MQEENEEMWNDGKREIVSGERRGGGRMEEREKAKKINERIWEAKDNVNETCSYKKIESKSKIK